MIRSFPFKSIKGDRKYCADDFALHEKTLYTSGILGNEDNNLQVFSNNKMEVKISPGFAVIQGHTFVNTDYYMISVDYADNRFNRIDRLVLQLDNSKRQILPLLKKGSYSTSPKAPDVIRNSDIYEIALADIHVNQGAISITQSNIRDLRHTSLCGISSFRGKPINIKDIYIQYEESLKDIVKILEKDLNKKQNTIDQLLNQFNNFVDLNQTEILSLVDKLNQIIESKDLAGELFKLLNKKQDRAMKDRANNNKYTLFFKNGELFFEEV